MAHQTVHTLAARQHGVVTRGQLLALGYSPEAIKHRIARGRLHPIWAGVYAVGRPDVTREGMWMAAVLAAGRGAVVSHASAAALWGIGEYERGEIEVTVPKARRVRRPGIRAHRRDLTRRDIGRYRGIPVTSPACTLIDVAPRLPRSRVERSVNEADRLDLVDPDTLRTSVRDDRRPGARTLRELLDRRTFVLTDSELERRFLAIARAAGLGKPRTGVRVNGFKVDFHWPALRLVVETDGLRYHRTPAQQARDRLRDQAHAAAGLLCLRFTHEQVAYDPEHVRATLRAVAERAAA